MRRKESDEERGATTPAEKGPEASFRGWRGFLLRPFALALTLVRRVFPLDRGRSDAADISESQQPDEFSDLENPFPEPVVIEFSDIIDLHSIPPAQAAQVVEDFLAHAQKHGFQWVRIIHGKGLGVQRERVRAILRRTPFVVTFCDAPPEAGGWGATVVSLSKPTPS